MKKHLLVLMSLFYLFSGYSVRINEPQQTQEQPHIVKRVSKEEFKEKLASLKDIQLVDVRTPEEFKKGTIKGAVNMNYYGNEFQKQISSLDRTKPVLLFCQSGGRSGKTLSKMKTMGFTTVFELEGGYGNWVR